MSLSGVRVSAAVVAVVYRLGDADPDIEQPQTGDNTAHGSVVQDPSERWMRDDEQVLVPDARPPGQDHDEHAEVDAEENEDEERETLEPDRSRAFNGAGWGRRQHRGLAIRKLLGEKLWLAWHQTLWIDLSRAVGCCLLCDCSTCLRRQKESQGFRVHGS